MKRWFNTMIMVLAAMVCMGTQAAFAAPTVPEDIYEWVQSSSRANYFFNKQQICYGTDAEGYIDQNVLIVPTLKTYDDVQIQDVVDKRRWKMLSMDGYDRLAGETEYLRINVAKRTVQIDESDDVDDTWSVLSSEHPADVTEIDKLAERNVDRTFYEGILNYAKKHQEAILAQSKGKIRPVPAAVKK